MSPPRGVRSGMIRSGSDQRATPNSTPAPNGTTVNVPCPWIGEGRSSSPSGNGRYGTSTLMSVIGPTQVQHVSDSNRSAHGDHRPCSDFKDHYRNRHAVEPLVCLGQKANVLQPGSATTDHPACSAKKTSSCPTRQSTCSVSHPPAWSHLKVRSSEAMSGVIAITITGPFHFPYRFSGETR